MNIPENINQSISHFMARNCTDLELSELYSWLEQSEENRAYFREILSIGSISEVLSDPDYEIKREKMISRINSRIDCEPAAQGKTVGMRSRIWYAVSAVAASILLLFGISWFFGLGSHRTEKEVPAILSYVNPTKEISPIHLEDGTEVLLGADTKISYYLSEVEGVVERTVEIQGNAYFDVKKDSTRPFIVHADDLLVRVLGTRFVVESHPDSAITQVLLQEGSVRLQTPDRVNLVRLIPDQKAVYRKMDADLDIEAASVSNYVMENYHKISFSRICMDELLERLEDLFGQHLVTDGEYDNSIRYEINFSRNNTLPEVLEIVEALTGERIQVQTE